MRTVLFINIHSRRGQRYAREVQKRFERASNFQVIETILVKDLTQFDKYIERLKNIKTVECVVVGSGDGTIIAVLNALKGRKNLTYAFLPLGTSNTFVRSLELPMHIKPAINVVLKQQARQISLGSVNGVLFANIAGIGLPVRVSQHISNRSKKYLGPLAYVLSGLKNLFGHDAIQCTITTDEQTETFHTHYLLIANGPYHGNLKVSRRASLFKNQLVLVVFGMSTSRWEYAKSMLSFARGNHINNPTVHLVPFKKAHLATFPKRSIEVDGEIIGKTPAMIEIKPSAIKVFATKA